MGVPFRRSQADDSFAISPFPHGAHNQKAVANESSQVSREGFLSVAASAVLGWTAAPPLSFAEGDEFSASVDPKPPRSISGCPKPTSGKANNCVSTSNVKQLE